MTATTSYLLEARDLHAALPGDAGDVAVLGGVSLAVAAGEVVDVTGPSGSGKSTLLRALARLLPAATGELSFAGVSAADFEPHDWRDRVTLLPQKPAIIDATVAENLLLPWRLRIRASRTRPVVDDLRRALDELGLAAVALERDAARLSAGQQARLAFARVWLTSPRVMLLDEPDAALDPDSADAMRTAIADFAAHGGAFAEEPAGVVRVRHGADDGLAVRRLRLEAGTLAEVGR